MTLPSDIPRIIKQPWEPEQNMYNLLLFLPDFQLRALAQEYTSTVPLAELWLSYTDEYRITLVNYFTPNFPPSVYLPYLYEYALCVLNGITPPVPETTMPAGIFDISAGPFNGRATYVSPSDHGYDNTQAIDEAIDAAAQAGGGVVLIPGGKFYSAGRHVIPRDNIWIVGLGKGVSYLYHEPTDWDNTGFLQFNANAIAPQLTTLGRVGVKGLSIRGDNPDLMSVAAANARKPKYAVQGVCTSGLYLDFDLQLWNTGSDYYAGFGGSEGYRSMGKEGTFIDGDAFNAWVTDIPIHIMQNPKEPGNQIDCDAYTFHNTYMIGKSGSAEPIIKADPGLNILRLMITGQNVWALGASGFELVEEIGEGFRDAANWYFENISCEQMTGGTTIKIHKKGGQKMVGLQLNNIVCNFVGTEGISLDGVKDAQIIGGNYALYTDQTTSPKALKLAGVIEKLLVQGFKVPSIVTNGADLIDEGPCTATRITTDRVASGTAGNQLDTICIYNS